ncbi:hypothetical protein [Streptomyces sp. MBT62]|uniref:hypothetical protein n=1 Tax=Streptomyces sp. MBT62 TaxID=2800410 RepID=UPI00190BA533|nr:hypothetical protein [Streptomyces sp. MBT62]MBK3566730.1 hypothetical protein [Streptomyces sp. MBT62]
MRLDGGPARYLTIAQGKGIRRQSGRVPLNKVTAAIGTSLSATITGCAATTDADGASSPSASNSGAERGSPTYEDGEFQADGWHGNLPSNIGLTVTLADGRIIAVKVVPHATDEISLALQRRFAAAVPRLVGQNIDSGGLKSRVGISRPMSDRCRIRRRP